MSAIVDRLGGVAANGYWAVMGNVSKAHRTPISTTLLAETRHEAELLEKQAQEKGEDGAHEKWSAWQAEIRRNMATGELGKFLTWPAVAYTMFVRHGSYIKNELSILQSQPDWNTRWKRAIKEDQLGNPLPWPMYPQSSANLIHHTYHVWVLENATGMKIGDFDRVVEFGGGYGGFTRTLCRLGFKGTTQVFDFPELNALQRFYVAALTEADTDGTMAGAIDRARFVSEKEDLDLPSSTDKSLFVAMWSISETPVAFREEWVDTMSACSHILIGFQARFYDVDNKQWFTELTERLSDYTWAWSSLDNGVDNYIIGTRKSAS
jgi:hypothetical protein